VSFAGFVASRYLRAKGRTEFRSLISTLAVGGVTVGVAAAIIVLGVMNGFTKEVRGRIVGTNAHVVLLDPTESGIADVDAVRRRVEAVEGVVATSAFNFGKVLLTSDDGGEGAVLRGCDLEAESRVTEVPGRIFPAGANFSVRESVEGDSLPGMVLGKDLAATLRTGLGMTVTATVPDVRGRGGIPRMRSFVVSGLFESGIYEYDAALALTSLEASAEALKLGDRATGILVRVDDMEKAPEIGRRIVEEVDPTGLWSNDWVRQNRQLFLWMKIEKLVGYLIFAIILIVAAFLIASTLIMIVLEKTREIGILMSLGAGRRGVRDIFLIEGMTLGGVGTGLGCLVGALGCFALDRYSLGLPGDVYFIDTLPVSLWWGDVAMVVGLSLLICLFSSLYPSWRASKLVPVEAIRYE
jgi:lipoprotein-releasing system permease protein